MGSGLAITYLAQLAAQPGRPNSRLHFVDAPSRAPVSFTLAAFTIDACPEFTDMTFNIHELLADLANSRPLFHSEADFQHSFAWELHRRFPDASIRLEKPIPINGGVAHLDVLVQRHNATIAIELKYKTRKLSVVTPSETYSLRNHSAQDIGRYDFIKDVSRLEDISFAYPEAVGYAVLLTNESGYWRNPSTATTVDAAFRLHEGRILSGDVAWGSGASAGTMKAREKPIQLRASYALEWRDFSSPATGNGSVFRYLAVPIQNGG